jgi:hypothetical protein
MNEALSERRAVTVAALPHPLASCGLTADVDGRTNPAKEAP